METSKITMLYNGEKSRAFVNHLINAYLPLDKISKVWKFEDKLTYHKCSVCSHELIDVETLMERIKNVPENIITDFVTQLSRDINGIETKPEDRYTFKTVTRGALMAVTGKNTTSILCESCVKELLDMVQTGLIMGDKNISYQVNRMRRNEVFSAFKTNPKLDSSDVKKVAEIEQRVEKSPKHVTTLGDYNVLKQLKEKMESEQKKH